jgi:hypothetical protein
MEPELAEDGWRRIELKRQILPRYLVSYDGEGFSRVGVAYRLQAGSRFYFGVLAETTLMTW